MLAQGTLQNYSANTIYPNRCGDEEMHAERDLGGNRTPSLASEVVSDSSLKAGGETNDAITTKEPSEQREMEAAVLHSEDNLAADKHSGLCYTQVFTKVMKAMFYILNNQIMSLRFLSRDS